MSLRLEQALTQHVLEKHVPSGMAATPYHQCPSGLPSPRMSIPDPPSSASSSSSQTEKTCILVKQEAAVGLNPKTHALAPFLMAAIAPSPTLTGAQPNWPPLFLTTELKCAYSKVYVL